eukprot:gnl/MRDRNA2_/MRDRNA2_230275_c0_seq1.p1 gnl/MRDRNA2_/MRDRNA2_230275_c0~~gnl/MRDRNA2_/MRDRNA2_230275_c0_seq1.p1  ORF type:complete len:127 (+),score=9.44 gnl/MRDRNA2_/MRDRNA2_230275_c0_seq1:36-416(+)
MQMFTRRWISPPVWSSLDPWPSFGLRLLHEYKFRPQKDVDTTRLPFKIRRTPSGNLPIYVRQGPAGPITTIKKVFGDKDALAAEVSRICTSERTVRKAVAVPDRKEVEIDGVWNERLKQWLCQLGL